LAIIDTVLSLMIFFAVLGIAAILVFRALFKDIDPSSPRARCNYFFDSVEGNRDNQNMRILWDL
jgi:hypothetical protein